MKIVNFFPLCVMQDQIVIENKQNLIEEIRKMKKNSENLNYQKDDASWTGDTQGFEFLYRNKKFQKLFDEIKKKINIYLDFLKIDKDQMDIYIQRSWATISNGKEVISKHQHLQSHLSFAYYLKKGDKDSNFVLHDEYRRKQLYQSIYLTNTKIKSYKPSYATATQIGVNVNEDDIIISPSKSSHSTQQI